MYTLYKVKDKHGYSQDKINTSKNKIHGHYYLRL